MCRCLRWTKKTMQLYGVLMNTAIAEAQDAVLMAEAMRDGVAAGRKALLAGRMSKKLYASASCPLSGVVR